MSLLKEHFKNELHPNRNNPFLSYGTEKNLFPNDSYIYLNKFDRTVIHIKRGAA